MTKKVITIGAAIQKRLAEAQGKLETLRQGEITAAERVAAVKTERSKYIVEARTGNAEAQERLQLLNGELTAAERDHADAVDAIAQIEAKIGELNRDLKAAAYEQQRSAVKEKLLAMGSVKREQRIVKYLKKAIEEIDALAADSNSLFHALRLFDPETANSGLVQRLQEGLMGVAPVRTWAWQFEEHHAKRIPGQLANLLEAVERAEPKTAVRAASAAASASGSGKKFYSGFTEALRAEYTQPNSDKKYSSPTEAMRAELTGDTSRAVAAAEMSESGADTQLEPIGRDFRWVDKK